MRDVDPRDMAPHEQERDAAIERALVRDGRPLSLLAVVARFDGARGTWTVEIWHRLDFLAMLDRAGQVAQEETDRELSKGYAAWVRGLRHGVCPQLFLWSDRETQRGQIERAKEAADAPKRP
jgi:hypothetical protein